MKMKEQHIVSLSEQALAVLEEVRKLNNPMDSPLLFPCRTDINKPISEIRFPRRSETKDIRTRQRLAE
jgi:hypothetical protein